MRLQRSPGLVAGTMAGQTLGVSSREGQVIKDRFFFVVVVSEWGHEWIRVVSVGLRLAPISPI